MTRHHFPERFSSATETLPRVPRLVITPFIGVKTLSVRAEIQGIAEKKRYKSVLSFSNVQFSEVRDQVHRVPIIETSRNKTFYMKPLDNSNKVRVRDSCQDFFFVFGFWNWRNQALQGPKPRPYVRKTTTYPERNPRHVPGLCKHLVAVFLRLRRLPIFR